MNRQQLFELIRQKQSFLCVGLDSDIRKIPAHLLGYDDPVFEFNKAVIDATIDFAVAYKPNLAFYESRGMKGMQSLVSTMDSLKNSRVRCLPSPMPSAVTSGIPQHNTQRLYSINPTRDRIRCHHCCTLIWVEDSVKPFLTSRKMGNRPGAHVEQRSGQLPTAPRQRSRAAFLESPLRKPELGVNRQHDVCGWSYPG
jgi:orotidine-5'-phosphate decarboxylase